MKEKKFDALKFEAFRFDWNAKQIEKINVILRLKDDVRRWLRKKEEPLEELVKSRLQYCFWSKAEYEISVKRVPGGVIVSDAFTEDKIWRDLNKAIEEDPECDIYKTYARLVDEKYYKLDVYDFLLPNIKVLTDVIAKGGAEFNILNFDELDTYYSRRTAFNVLANKDFAREVRALDPAKKDFADSVQAAARKYFGTADSIDIKPSDILDERLKNADKKTILEAIKESLRHEFQKIDVFDQVIPNLKVIVEMIEESQK